MVQSVSKNDRILIVGGGTLRAQPLMQVLTLISWTGTFGTSTAFHLSQRGYNNITVLDRFAAPSQLAAGNDLNKVIRADYAEPLYTKLATESAERWRDPNGLYAGLYHRTGWLIVTPERGVALDFVHKAIENAHAKGFEAARPVSAAEVTQSFPAYTGKMEGWKIFHQSAAGWASAGKALRRMAEAAQRQGVKYFSGADGYVKVLVFDASGRCTGAELANGVRHVADHIVLAAGAASGGILDMKGQLTAKGHTVGHIQLSTSEVEKYAGMPMVDHFEGGLMFPPQEDGIIKLGACQFATNFVDKSGPSLPRYRCDNPRDPVPQPVEDCMRNFVRQLAPELADREWSNRWICWDADTKDRHFLIDRHPEHAGLSLAVGGSAHGFKFLPVIGGYVADMLEGTLDTQARQKWRWRPEVEESVGSDPHTLPLLDLNDLPEFNNVAARL